MPKSNSIILRKLIDYLDPNRRILSNLKILARKHAYSNKGLPFIDSQSFEKLLAHAITNKIPFCCGKIGGVESHVCRSMLRSWVQNDLTIPIRARNDSITNAGIYPNSYAGLSSFTRIFINSISHADVIQSWFQAGELETIQSAITSIPPFLAPLTSLEPYYGHSALPWTHTLEHKKVLVVSPFAESISQQFTNRLHIWPSGLLPDFDLMVLKFPHSPLTDSSISSDFFDRLSYFKKQISELEFDVLIAGCGAAAFPLASFAKQLNRVGIAMGGSLQILFGIRGRRWDNDPFFRSFYNPYWIRPNINEVPSHASLVENNAYW